MGRHIAPPAVGRRQRRPNLFRWTLIALVAIVVVGLGVFGYNKVFGGCGDIASISVAADPTIASVVSKVAASADPEDLGCAKLDVQAKAPAEVAQTLSKPESLPALWIPDSSAWMVKALKATGAPLDSASQSIATTPVVIATKQGDTPLFDTWLSVLKRPGLRIGDPLTDTVANGPVLAALAEAEKGKVDPNAITAALVPIAQAQATNTKQKTADERLAEVNRDGGVAIATEEQVVAYNAANSGANLVASVPVTGAFVLNYPIAVTAPAGEQHDKAKEAGVKLAEAIVGSKALSEAGFRGPDFAPLDGNRGAGKLEVLTVSDQTVVDTALRRYAVLALPARFLAVLDVSGSMKTAAGGTTRIDLLGQALENTIRLFPDNAQVGLWAFSIDKGGPGQDWRELLPIRTLGDKFDGKSQRELVLEQDRNLGALVGGGTGLYDTTLAAFRKVQSTYDPHYINSIVIATDGTNEDPNSISLEELLATLKKEQDPSRPVIIVTAGITDDADAAVLKQISDATPGGSSVIARNAADIPNIVVEVLKARTR
ncbi:VWA domain-containing protein [Nocardiaceae bacterium YC2-7]|uniref:VWA domain-containing protein n=1 Tax=Antrihabitans stalactiti TaxID=2584121 RepID=A0A848KFS0_9NOCA|nr:VWA domain-containing protein [Antrihabitans stalactiti]NMN96498.1 VWA domain-containing protein [Antrihabitans stalactiti]